jgi:alpha-beta hydrolase superfamily lysophospholipase
MQLASTNYASLPLFLFGHSMGALTINTFLQNNPTLAAKLAGVIYGAPLFGAAKTKTPTELSILDAFANNF